MDLELSQQNAFYHRQKEPVKSCLLALHKLILAQNNCITPAWRYGMPFFNYKGKMFCYLWLHRKYKQPYIGIVEGNKVEHPLLIQENRARMKIMLIDPERDLPARAIKRILAMAVRFYK